MKEIHGTQVVEDILGRKIIVSAGKGLTNLEDLNWLEKTVLKKVSTWKETGWAYIADCTEMQPVGPKESAFLIEMTKTFVEAGCKAFGFAEGKSIMLKAQTKTNTKFSKTGITEGHFSTVEEALDWLKKDLHF